MATNTSFFVLKPEGVRNARYILRYLQKREFRLERVEEFTFTEEMLIGIYPNLVDRPNFIGTPREHLVGKTCIKGIVRCKNAVKRLLWVSGHHRIPGECQVHTIRYLFGDAEPILAADGDKYYRNVIHRPQTIEEVWAHAPLFGIRPAELT